MKGGRPSARLMLLMLRDQLAVSLPVLLMALLAAGTWWLIRNTPNAEGPLKQSAKRHEVDYSMGRFTTERFGPDGVLRAVIEGQELNHYADTDTVEIEQMRAHGVDEAGRRYRAEAQHSVSDRGAVHIQLTGKVNLLREAVQPGRPQAKAGEGRVELNAEALVIDTEAEQAHSARPVTLISESGEVRANALDYDGEQGQTWLRGRVRGSYLGEPRVTTGSAAASAASGVSSPSAAPARGAVR